MTDHLPILRETDLRRLIPTEKAIEIVRIAYEDYGRTRKVLSQPSAMQLKPPGSAITYKLKGGFSPSLNASGFRLAGFGNGQLTTHCIVMDPQTGAPLGLVDETWLHRLRTAVSSAVVATWLARPESRTLAIVGAGQIAMNIPAAFAALFDLKEIRIASRSHDSAEALAQHAQQFATAHACTDVDEAAEGADIVVSVTSATSPVLFPRHLARGATLIGLGGNAELHVDVLDVADLFVVDDLEFACEAGSIAGWLKAGHRPEEIEAALDADIGEIACGTKPGRRGADDRALAIIQGMANCDVALAAYALQQVLK